MIFPVEKTIEALHYETGRERVSLHWLSDLGHQVKSFEFHI